MYLSSYCSVGFICILMTIEGSSCAGLHEHCNETAQCSPGNSVCLAETCQCQPGLVELESSLCMGSSETAECASPITKKIVGFHPIDLFYRVNPAKFGYFYQEDKEFRGEAILANPPDLCDLPSNMNTFKDKIVLAWRGNCTFEKKSIVASLIEALGLLILDTSPNAQNSVMVPSSCYTEEDTSVPAVLISGFDEALYVHNKVLYREITEISLISCGSWLGQSCATVQDCKGYPLSMVCGGRCRCNRPYFNKLNGQCVRDVPTMPAPVDMTTKALTTVAMTTTGNDAIKSTSEGEGNVDQRTTVTVAMTTGFPVTVTTAGNDAITSGSPLSSHGAIKSMDPLTSKGEGNTDQRTTVTVAMTTGFPVTMTTAGHDAITSESPLSSHGGKVIDDLLTDNDLTTAGTTVYSSELHLGPLEKMPRREFVCKSQGCLLFTRSEAMRTAGLVLAEIGAISLAECSSACWRQDCHRPICGSFVYNRLNSTCVLQTEADAVPWSVRTENGWEFYSPKYVTSP